MDSGCVIGHMALREAALAVTLGGLAMLMAMAALAVCLFEVSSRRRSAALASAAMERRGLTVQPATEEDHSPRAIIRDALKGGAFGLACLWIAAALSWFLGLR